MATDDRIAALQEENARLRADLTALLDRTEPEPGALHYNECPYKPYADLPSWDTPEDAPDCTCSMLHKATYWKSRWMLSNGAREVAEARVAALTEECERLRGALVTAAIPLEALLATECGTERALSDEMKRAIRESVVEIRAVLFASPEPRRGDAGVTPGVDSETKRGRATGA